MKLSELGERRIIAELLYPRYSSAQGTRYYDDCALLSMGGSYSLAVTTDPCPRPMAAILGETDPYYYGWLLATINLSDLAAVGARPLGLLTSLIAPSDMLVDDFERLLTGIDDACRLCGTTVVGGNIKEGPELQCSGTAIGLCEAGKELRRSGARHGDLLVAIGDLGEFWAYSLNRLYKLGVADGELERGRQNLLTPVPRVQEGMALASLGTVSACMDNSDGIYACAKELAAINGHTVILDFADARLSQGVVQVAEQLGVAPYRLALGWGDWQLVAAVPPTYLDAVASILSRVSGAQTHVIGRFAEGAPHVLLACDGIVSKMEPVDSERFAPDSWFTAGIERYIATLLGKTI